MDLAAYLDRIGFSGPARPDLATLTSLHRHHLMAIPYENLDVQLGRPMTIDPAAAFDKLVTGRRGGWCYEMNGLFGSALVEIGFKVTRLAGGVLRSQRGDEAVGNHLVLRVELDQPYIADVGFGDAMLEPAPWVAGPYRINGYDFRLERLDEVWWRVHNHDKGGASDYDVSLAPAADERLAAVCAELSTAPDSIFQQNCIVMRHRPDGLAVLLGRTLHHIAPGQREFDVIGSAEAFMEVLATTFGLDVPEARGLWPKVCARHEELFPPAGALGA